MIGDFIPTHNTDWMAKKQLNIDADQLFLYTVANKVILK